MSVKSLSVALLGLAAVLSASDVRAADILFNGGFDSPSQRDFAVPGWVLSPGFGSHPDSNFRTEVVTRSGAAALALGNGSEDPFAALWQYFDDVAGEVYNVEFWALSNPGDGLADPNGFLDVQVDKVTDIGTSNMVFRVVPQNNDFRFEQGSFTFTGTGHDRVLIGAQSNKGGFVIDDVSITDTGTMAGVPEPTTWALMIMGLGGIGAALRRRPRPETV